MNEQSVAYAYACAYGRDVRRKVHACICNSEPIVQIVASHLQSTTLTFELLSIPLLPSYSTLPACQPLLLHVNLHVHHRTPGCKQHSCTHGTRPYGRVSTGLGRRRFRTGCCGSGRSTCGGAIAKSIGCSRDTRGKGDGGHGGSTGECDRLRGGGWVGGEGGGVGIENAVMQWLERAE